jgi:hypothetical protein
VLFTLMLPTLLIPLVGLGIDATMLYIVQAKLSAATDGAALGAGRLLGTLADPAEIAGEFLRVNFPTNNTAGFWGAYNLVPTITYVPGITKTITVNATARVPLLFSRVFGQNNALVSAAAVAVRNDTRVVLVLDRSTSMNTTDHAGSTVIADAKAYASSFVQKFTEGSDELGLVVFGGSAIVAYPPAAANGTTSAISLASTGGPNKTFWDGTANDIPHQIANISAGSYTGTAEALSLAYIEIQKAHMRDLNADGVDTRLNSIVLLTDGVPTAVTLNPNNGVLGSVDNIIKTTSACTNKGTASVSPTTKMIGWFANSPTLPFTVSGTNINGLYQPSSTDPTTARTSSWWMSNPNADYTTVSGIVPDPNPIAPFNGCTGLLGSQSNLDNSTNSDIRVIPNHDYYGNLMTGNAYTYSQVSGGGSVTSIYTGTALDLTKPTSEYHWAMAIFNGVDNAAYRIRTDANLANRTGDTTGNMNIAIYAIGYTGNGGCDDGLLKRVANDKSASSYDASQRTGVYVSADDKVGLANAFNTVASAILRLAY